MQSLQIIFDALPYILGGSIVTIANVCIALAMGLLLGVPLAVIQVYGPNFLRRAVSLYVWIFRGVPILVLLFLFFGLFVSLGFAAEPFVIACLVLGCTSTAYQSQIFRGAIQAISQGQLKAARALGMTDFQAIRHIILPQAIRMSIPGFANEFSILLKDSAICYVLGTQEIMARANFVASRTHEHLALFATAGVLYFIITYFGVKLLRILEQKIYVPGYAVN